MGGRSKRSGEQDELGRFRAITPEVRELQSRVRAAFVEIRKELAPNAATAVSKKSDDVFLQVAFKLRETGQSVEEFVEERLRWTVLNGGELWPQVLLSDKVGLQVEFAREEADDLQRSRYYFQVELFTRCAKLYPPRTLITDPVRSFSPLFRYTMAMAYGFSDLAEKYRLDAREELARYPVARQLFAKEAATI